MNVEFYCGYYYSGIVDGIMQSMMKINIFTIAIT